MGREHEHTIATSESRGQGLSRAHHRSVPFCPYCRAMVSTSPRHSRTADTGATPASRLPVTTRLPSGFIGSSPSGTSAPPRIPPDGVELHAAVRRELVEAHRVGLVPGAGRDGVRLVQDVDRCIGWFCCLM